PESEVYHKSDLLYGIYQGKSSIVKSNNCFLVEGYTDVLSMHQAGIENVVASSGTSLTGGQIRQIHRFTENITVLYDGDAAGIKASLRGIDLLLEEGMNVKIVLLPDGDDPDSFSKKQSAADFTVYIKAHETDFITFKTNLLIDDAGNDPIRRATLISDIVQSISVIPDDITRSVYIKECSRMMDMREDVLLQAVGKERMKKIEQGNAPLRRPVETPAPTIIDENPADGPAPEGVAPTKSPYPFEIYEQHLVKLIVKYGFTPLTSNGDVIDDVVTFITSELKRDNIEIETPVYKKITDETLLMRNQWIKDYTGEIFTFNDIACDSEKEKIKFWCKYVTEINAHLTRHFLNHQDENVSITAVNMISEKYHLSKKQTAKSEEERIYALTRRAITELKDAIVSKHITDLNSNLKIAYRQKQNDMVAEILKELNCYKTIKSQLAKELGERIINP
ncbi:MAG: toprim domain-containing protein, partial [Bacteroidales bacterium]